jgi:hypothetical protein
MQASPLGKEGIYDNQYHKPLTKCQLRCQNLECRCYCRVHSKDSEICQKIWTNERCGYFLQFHFGECPTFKISSELSIHKLDYDIFMGKDISSPSIW